MPVPAWIEKELAEMPLPKGEPHYCAVPASEFSKEQLIKLWAMSMMDKERESELHLKALRTFQRS